VAVLSAPHTRHQHILSTQRSPFPELSQCWGRLIGAEMGMAMHLLWILSRVGPWACQAPLTDSLESTPGPTPVVLWLQVAKEA
jgi:hypothetical protein